MNPGSAPMPTGPFGNTYEEDEVSPKVEVGGVAGLKCLQPSWETNLWSQYLTEHLEINVHITDSNSNYRTTQYSTRAKHI